MNDNLIIHPVIPYNGKIGNGRKFNPGKLIIIKAAVPKLTNGFNIKLQSDPKQNSSQEDIALQISVQHLSQCICLNSFVQGKWGEEVCKSIGTDENLEIVLSCEFNKYQVNINGEYFYEYPQTIHYDNISHLNIDGDVSIVQISYELVSDSCKVVEELPLLDNDCDPFDLPPPPYAIAINDSEDLKPYPVQPMHAEIVAAYQAEQIRQLTDEVSSNSTVSEPENGKTALKGISAFGAFMLIIWIIFRIIKAAYFVYH